MSESEINQLLKRRKNLERIKDHEQKARDRNSLQASKKRLIYCHKTIDYIDIELNKLDPSRFKISETLEGTIERNKYITKLIRKESPQLLYPCEKEEFESYTIDNKRVICSNCSNKENCVKYINEIKGNEK